MTRPNPDVIDMAAPVGGFIEDATLLAMRAEATVAEIGQRVVSVWDSDEWPYVVGAAVIVAVGTGVVAFARAGQTLKN